MKPGTFTAVYRPNPKDRGNYWFVNVEKIEATLGGWIYSGVTSDIDFEQKLLKQKVPEGISEDGSIRIPHSNLCCELISNEFGKHELQTALEVSTKTLRELVEDAIAQGLVIRAKGEDVVVRFDRNGEDEEDMLLVYEDRTLFIESFTYNQTTCRRQDGWDAWDCGGARTALTFHQPETKPVQPRKETTMSNEDVVMLCLPEGHSGEFKYKPEETQAMFLAAVGHLVDEIANDPDMTKAQAAKEGARAVLSVIDGKHLVVPGCSLRSLEPDNGDPAEHDYRADIAGNLASSWDDAETMKLGRELLRQATDEFMASCAEQLTSDEG
jgi:hypothetical protein